MVSVSFKSKTVPKELKHYFKKSGFKKSKKLFTLEEADKAIRQAAGEIPEHKSFDITFKLEWEDDGDLHEALFEDVKVQPEDSQFGIKELIENDLAGETSTEAYAVRDLMDLTFGDFADLQEESQDTEASSEELDELNHLVKKNNDTESKTTDTELAIETTEPTESVYSPSQSQDVATTEPESSFQLGQAATPNSDQEVVSDSTNDLSGILSGLDDQNPSETTKVSSVAPQTVNNDALSQQIMNNVILLSEYIDGDKIDKVLKTVSSESFELEKLQQRFGYIDDPQDEFDKELNSFIDEKIRTFGLDEMGSTLRIDLQELKDSNVEELRSFYKEINSSPVSAQVEEEAAEEIADVGNQTQNELDENNSRFEERIETKRTNIQSTIVDKVKAYQDKLELEGKEELEKFQTALENEKAEFEKQKQKVTQAEIEKIKNKVTEQIVTARNTELLDRQQEVLADLSQQVNDVYIKASDSSFEKSKKIQGIVSEKKNDLVKARKQAEQEALFNEREERKLQEQKRANDILEKNQEEVPEKVAKNVVKEVLPLIQSGNHNQLTDQTLIAEINDLKKQLEALKLQKIKQEHDEEVADLKKAFEVEIKKNKQDLKKTKGKAVIASLAMLLISASIFGGYIYFVHSSVSSSATDKQVSVVKSKKSSSNPIHEDSISSSREGTKDVASTAEQALKPDKVANNLIFYNAAQSEMEKNSILNGILGQMDLQSIVAINASHSTPLSKLYEAIIRKDGEEIRARYLILSEVDRSYLSDSARYSIALAFYDVYDWHNGWAVRYEK